MRSRMLKLLIGVTAVVALGSVLIGLASPDGSVSGASPVNQGPRPATATPSSPAPSAGQDTATPAAPSGPDLAPASVADRWAGLPSGATVSGRSVDWCGAVRTSGAAEAERVFGREAVDAAACAAVSFVLDHRYSRLSLPRRTYEADDFDDVLPALDPRTASDVYRPRIDQFVGAPESDRAGEQLGLVLFTGRSTPRGADHASAGRGHVFYGPAFTNRGYRDRSAWINPAWSTVGITVDRSTAEPRISATFRASAAMPVYDTARGRDAMMTVPTQATFLLRRAGDGERWRINGWTIKRGTVSYASLTVR